ncbi:MAG TPA: bifunctional oligoribonuclease/PAP phosphatase NrnA [Thermotogota bacterium]|nr:bifunctional oligoribonuclease/PAP phosphatase NrnA [Thermotogota bacterium]
MISEKKALEVKSFFDRYRSFLIISHVQPDGDAISSSLSLSFGLRRLGKETQTAIDWPIPEVFQSIPLCDQIRGYPIDNGFDAVVFVDGSSPDRMGRFAKLLDEKPSCIIDHHRSALSFGTMQWVEPTASATAQLILLLNKLLEVPYDSILATLNLLGLQTDSGFFRYSNTTADLFRDAAFLMEHGAQPYFNASTILENKKTEEFHLLTRMIEKIEVLLSGKLVYSYITQEMLLASECAEEDTAGFIGELRSIKGTECAILFVESETGDTRVSFRSKKWFDVSQVAVHFGGGGHLKASGCSLRGDFFKNIDTVVRFVERKMTESTASDAILNLLSDRGQRNTLADSGQNEK